MYMNAYTKIKSSNRELNKKVLSLWFKTSAYYCAVFRFRLVRDIISFSSEKVLLSGVAYTITLVYIICLILTYFLGESIQAHAYLLWEALFLFIILVINFLVAFNEEYQYRNEIPHRVRKVLGEFNLYFIALRFIILHRLDTDKHILRAEL